MLSQGSNTDSFKFIKHLPLLPPGLLGHEECFKGPGLNSYLETSTWQLSLTEWSLPNQAQVGMLESPPITLMGSKMEQETVYICYMSVGILWFGSKMSSFVLVHINYTWWVSLDSFIQHTLASSPPPIPILLLLTLFPFFFLPGLFSTFTPPFLPLHHPHMHIFILVTPWVSLGLLTWTGMTAYLQGSYQWLHHWRKCLSLKQQPAAYGSSGKGGASWTSHPSSDQLPICSGLRINLWALLFTLTGCWQAHSCWSLALLITATAVRSRR